MPLMRAFATPLSPSAAMIITRACCSHMPLRGCWLRFHLSDASCYFAAAALFTRYAIAALPPLAAIDAAAADVATLLAALRCAFYADCLPRA